jgi:hypothetical protein
MCCRDAAGSGGITGLRVDVEVRRCAAQSPWHWPEEGTVMRVRFGAVTAAAFPSLVCGTALADPSATYLEPVLKSSD